MRFPNNFKLCLIFEQTSVKKLKKKHQFLKRIAV